MRAYLLTMAALLVLAGCGTPVPPAPAAPAPPPSPIPSTPVAPLRADPAAAKPPPTVVLDPGHNGGNAEAPSKINRLVPDGRGGKKACNTTGTSTDDGYPEHALNWDVALRVRDALAAHGVRVLLTRSNDSGVGPCVDERAAIGNRADADAVVSIHADGSGGAGRGFHVAYSQPPLNNAQGTPSVRLATTLRDALRDADFVPADYVGEEGLDGRADLAGLNHSRRPVALVECANLRNPDEAALASSAAGRARYAAAIADGVLAWLASR